MQQGILQQGVLKQGELFAERRAIDNDRRSNQRKAALYSIYRNRRKQLRRDGDNLIGVYVDAHEPKLFYLATGLMMLSVLDAFFTTLLIANGSEELNPVLAHLLAADLIAFLGAKFFITGFSILFFVMHRHHRLFNLISCYQLLVFSVAVYVLLIGYQLTMVRHLTIIHF
ncbi:MAG TPA: DUF5658 family protein [Gammaproteobacteria bacterium]